MCGRLDMKCFTPLSVSEFEGWVRLGLGCKITMVQHDINAVYKVNFSDRGNKITFPSQIKMIRKKYKPNRQTIKEEQGENTRGD